MTNFTDLADLQHKIIEEAFNRVSGFSVEGLEPINTPGFQRLFHGEIEKVEKREKLPEFQPSLQNEKNTLERLKVLEQVKQFYVPSKIAAE